MKIFSELGKKRGKTRKKAKGKRQKKENTGVRSKNSEFENFLEYPISNKEYPILKVKNGRIQDLSIYD